MTFTAPKISTGNLLAQSKLKLSWLTVSDAIEALAYMVKPLNIHLVVGISRGGLIPGLTLSHRLNCPLEIISASSYEGTRRTLQKPTQIEGWKQEYDSTHTLVVDDILDTGKTLEAIRYKTGIYNHNFRFASLVTKRPELNSQNIYFAQVPRDVWVQFPWEQDES